MYYNPINTLRIKFASNIIQMLIIFPITELYRIKPTDNDDTDQFDLAILQVRDIGQDEDLFSDHRPYELLENNKFTIFNPNSKFIYRGFPTELRHIDWEKKQIRHSAFLGHAKYLGPAEWKGIHILKLIGSEDLSNPDGLSGSPIFQINQDDHGYATEAFAGMLIRSSAQSDKAHFLEHKFIIDTLVDIHLGIYSVNDG